MHPSSSDLDSEHTSVFGASKRKKRRAKYLRSEDLAILRYLLDDDHCSTIGGNTVWKDMHMLKVTKHTWQSMKARFTKCILPNIGQYSLKKHEEAKLSGVLKRKALGQPTDNPTPPQVSPVEATAAQTPPLVLEYKPAEDAHGDISTDDQLDDFDRLLFANAPDNPEVVTASVSPSKHDMPSVTAGVNDSVTQQVNGASTRILGNVTAVPKRTQNGDGETIADHVPRMRRKRPLEFRTLTNGDDMCNENGASVTNVTSVPTDETACYVDLTVPCKVVIGKCPSVDSIYRGGVKSSQKRHTRRLRSPDDELEIVEVRTSPETSPLKTTERKVAKTRCTVEAAEDNSITRAATKTKRTKHSVRKGGDTSTEIRRQTRSASRLEQDSDEEEEKDGDEYIDPRSYLASKRDQRRRSSGARSSGARSSGARSSPSKGLQSVISFVMVSSDDSQEEEADCDDEVETHRDQRKGNISQNNEQKQQVAQHKDGMSQQLKIFDSIVQWLAMPPKDFVDIVLRCDGSVDDAVVFILTGHKKAGGSTSHVTESIGDIPHSTAAADHPRQKESFADVETR